MSVHNNYTPDRQNTCNLIQPDFSNIPRELCKVKGWLNWNKEPHQTKPDKFRKIPYYADGSPRRGKQGTPADRAKLTVLAEALERVYSGYSNGVGLAILPGCGYVAADYDNCVDDEGNINPRVLELVKVTYYELSPSGKGIRAFFRGSMSSKKNIPEGIEIFGDSGFVTVTGNRLSDTSEIIDLTEDIRAQINNWLGVKPKPTRLKKCTPSNREPIEKIKSALDSLPISLIRERDTWLKVCCALHDEFGGDDEGFNLFDEWSQKADGAYGQTEETWFSLKGREDSITIATLYKLAFENGWYWEEEKMLESTDPISVKGFDACMQALTLSEEEAEKIANPEWIIVDVVIQGHLIVIPAQPNGGKTTIFFHLAGEMVKKGFKVYYVNTDISGGDAKSMRAEAAAMKVTLVLPDFKGSSMNEVVKRLEGLKAGGDDLGKYVFIFDTLKKMTDVIDKSRAKKLYELLRGLTAKGATIILLAHTNKYKGEDGMPVFEGTGDLRSDVDELIYLIPHKNPDGTMTVSTFPDKVRGAFQPVTFIISTDRKVSMADDHIDTKVQNELAHQRAQDNDAITAIIAAITCGESTKTKIQSYCVNQGVNRRRVDTVLQDYLGTNWKVASGNKNTSIYSLIE